MKKVIIYSTDSCGYCNAEKDWLEQKGISFEEKNIQFDTEALAELQSKLGGEFYGVPVTDIDGKIVIGFDRKKLGELLEIK